MLVTDLKLLRQAVVRDPYDDTVRMAYADALEESGDKNNSIYAEFIRIQFQLHAIGKQPLVINAVPRMLGPDVMQVVVGSYSSGWPETQVGKRVDVHHKPSIRPGRIQKYYNWLVTKMELDDAAIGTSILTLKRDEFSIPYPFKQAKELEHELYKQRPDLNLIQRAEIVDSLRSKTRFAAGPSSFPAINLHLLSPEFGPAGHSMRLTYERGFISHVSTDWRGWHTWGDTIIEHEPITSVKLTTLPIWAASTIACLLLAGKEVQVDLMVKLRNAMHGGIEKNIRTARSEVLSYRWPSIHPDRWELPPSASIWSPERILAGANDYGL